MMIVIKLFCLWNFISLSDAKQFSQFYLNLQEYYLANTSVSFYLSSPYLNLYDYALNHPTNMDADINLSNYLTNYSEYVGIIPSGSQLCPFDWSFLSVQQANENHQIVKTFQDGFRIYIEKPIDQDLLVGEYSIVLFRDGDNSMVTPDVMNYPDQITCDAKLLTPLVLMNFTVLDEETPIAGGGGFSLHFERKSRPGEEIDRVNIESISPKLTALFDVPEGRYPRTSISTMSKCSLSPFYPYVIKIGFTMEGWFQMIPRPQQWNPTFFNGLMEWTMILLTNSDGFSRGWDHMQLHISSRGGPGFKTSLFNSQHCNVAEDENLPDYDFDNGVFNLLDGSKNHLAVTWDPTTKDLSFYLNGKFYMKKEQCIPVDNWDVKLSSLTSVGIGGQFEGSLDELRVWKTSRSEPQIQQTMYRSLRNDELGQLLLYYDFNRVFHANGQELNMISYDHLGSTFANQPIIVEDRAGSGFNLQLGKTQTSYGSGVYNRFAPLFIPSTFEIIGGSLVSPIIDDYQPVSAQNPLTKDFATILPDRSFFNTNKLNYLTLKASRAIETIKFISTPVASKFTVKLNNQLLDYEQQISIASVLNTINGFYDVGDLQIENLNQSQEGLYNIQYQTFARNKQNVLISSPVYNLIIPVRKNRPPVAGEAGGVFRSNGWGQMGFAKDISLMSTMKDGGKDIGPITIEFWSLYYDVVHNSAGMLFDFGNSETNASWCDHYPNCHGRISVNTYFEANFMSQDFDPTQLYDSTVMVGTWNHFAMTHGGREDPTLNIYLNGKLMISRTVPPHEYDKFGLTLGRWTYYGPNWNSYRGLLDEFRIWKAVRTSDQINSYLYQPLDGKEPNLLVYYDFNSVIANDTVLVDEQVFNEIQLDEIDFSDSNNDLLVLDKSPNNFHLNLGGCAPMPKFCDNEECNPLDRPSYPCFYNPNSGEIVTDREMNYTLGRSSLVELRANVIPSITSPIRNGITKVQMITNESVMITLLGNDVDLRDQGKLWFYIRQMPLSGKLSFLNGTDISLGQPFHENEIKYSQINPNEGGQFYDTFNYGVTDGILHSSIGSKVLISVICDKGSLLQNKVCTMCPTGTFMDYQGFSTQCIDCPLKTYQDQKGQSSCKSIPFGSFQFSTGASDYLSCEDFSYVSDQCPKPKIMYQNQRYISYVFEGITTLFLVVVLLCTFIFRKITVLMCGSVPMLLIYTLGMMISQIGLFLFTLPTKELYCNLSVWFINLGYTIAFGSLFLKMYRIYYIFNNSQMRIINFSIQKLFALISVLCLVDVVLLLTFQFTVRFGTITQSKIQQCMLIGDSSTTVILIVYKFIILFGGMYIAFLSKNSPSAFNESRDVYRIIINMLFSLLICLFINFFSRDSFSSSFIHFSTIMILNYAIFSSVLILFLPKLIIAIRQPEKQLFSGLRSTSGKPIHQIAQKSKMIKKTDKPMVTIQVQKLVNGKKKTENLMALVKELKVLLEKTEIELQDSYWQDKMNDDEGTDL
ncbi:hypothetical protein BC833DRAFT_259882 [Globomyces pollinis-pini]|nr:hypothetical protein BC833DRAFT_259882 [Globomyces pollinis-pini]